MLGPWSILLLSIFVSTSAQNAANFTEIQKHFLLAIHGKGLTNCSAVLEVVRAIEKNFSPQFSLMRNDRTVLKLNQTEEKFFQKWWTKNAKKLKVTHVTLPKILTTARKAFSEDNDKAKIVVILLNQTIPEDTLKKELETMRCSNIITAFVLFQPKCTIELLSKFDHTTSFAQCANDLNSLSKLLEKAFSEIQADSDFCAALSPASVLFKPVLFCQGVWCAMPLVFIISLIFVTVSGFLFFLLLWCVSRASKRRTREARYSLEESLKAHQIFMTEQSLRFLHSRAMALQSPDTPVKAVWFNPLVIELADVIVEAEQAKRTKHKLLRTTVSLKSDEPGGNMSPSPRIVRTTFSVQKSPPKTPPFQRPCRSQQSSPMHHIKKYTKGPRRHARTSSVSPPRRSSSISPPRGSTANSPKKPVIVRTPPASPYRSLLLMHANGTQTSTPPVSPYRRSRFLTTPPASPQHVLIAHPRVSELRKTPPASPSRAKPSSSQSANGMKRYPSNNGGRVKFNSTPPPSPLRRLEEWNGLKVHGSPVRVMRSPSKQSTLLEKKISKSSL